MPQTGNGATIVLGTSLWTGSVVEITGLPEDVAVLDASHLGTVDEAEYLPSDLKTRSPITVRAYANMNSRPPIKTVETITITFAKQAGQTNGPTLAGTAFVNSRTGPASVNGQLMMYEFTVMFDGYTGPTYANGS